MAVRVAVLVVFAAAIGAGVGADAAAVARRPPRGLYQCYERTRAFGTLYSGGFRLVARGRYTLVSRGQRWRYVVRGRRVRFVDGPYRSFAGRARRDRKRHRWAIDLTLSSDRSVVQRCHWTHA